MTLSVNDSTIPVITGSVNVTRYLVNQSINASFNLSDNSALHTGQVIITDLGEKRFYNFTINGVKTTNISQNFTITAYEGNINVTGWANDTSGNYNQAELILGITKDINVSLKNRYDNTTIRSYSVTIFNRTFSENQSTINGTMMFSNIMKGNYSFNISSEENGGYYNLTLINVTFVNSTFKLQDSLYQAILYVTGNRRGTQYNVTSFNASMPRNVNQSNSSGQLTFLVNASKKYNLSGYSTDYFDTYKETPMIGNKSTSFADIEFYDINVSISIYSNINNTIINNITIKLRGNDSEFTENLSSGAMTNVTFSLGNSTYFIDIFHPRHSDANSAFTIASNSNFPNLTFSLWGINAINFSLRDEFNRQLILKNSSINMIGTTFISNFTIQNGSLYVQDLPTEEYRIEYAVPDYRQRTYYFNMVNGTNSSVILYLLSTTNGTFTTFTVNDQNANPVENFTLKAQRYYLQTNAYEVVAMIKTDAQGQGQIDLQHNTAFYKFIVVDANGNIHFDSIPNTVFSTAYTIRISEAGNAFESIREGSLVFKNLTFSNISNSFTFTYNDANGLAAQTCLKAQSLSLRDGASVICNTCSTSASATLVCPVNSSIMANKTIIATALLFTSSGQNSTTKILDEQTITPNALVENVKQIFGKTGVFIGWILIIAMVMLGLWNPIVALVFGTVGFITTYMLGIITLGTVNAVSLIVGLVLLVGITIYRSRV